MSEKLEKACTRMEASLSEMKLNFEILVKETDKICTSIKLLAERQHSVVEIFQAQNALMLALNDKYKKLSSLLLGHTDPTSPPDIP